MIDNLEDFIVRAIAKRDGDVYELKDLADNAPEDPAPYLPRLLAADVVYPAKLYRAADSETQRGLVAEADADDKGELHLNHLLMALAQTRGPVAKVAFQLWRDQPPPSADKLCLGPAEYMPEGGWMLEGEHVRYPVDSAIGGRPVWMEEANYPECPACGKLMTYIAQIDVQAINHLVGYHTFFLHTEYSHGSHGLAVRMRRGCNVTFENSFVVGSGTGNGASATAPVPDPTQRCLHVRRVGRAQSRWSALPALISRIRLRRASRLSVRWLSSWPSTEM